PKQERTRAPAGARGGRAREPVLRLRRSAPIGARRNRGAAGELGITEGRLPVARGRELRAVQELGTYEVRAGQIGAVEDGLEEIGTRQVGVRQDRAAEDRAAQVGSAKIG